MANVQLAKNLKILRKKHNYTQQDLSDILILPDKHTPTMNRLFENRISILWSISPIFIKSLWMNSLQAIFIPTRSGNPCPSTNIALVRRLTINGLFV